MSPQKIFTIKHFDTVSSTNTLAKNLAKQGEKEFTVIIADEQTNGRGRLNRSFYSPKNSGIYMSVILRPNLPIKDSTLITTAAAVAVCKAIENICKISPEIKWVNDIFVKNKKVCGILTESAVNPKNQKTDFAVLGIGINLYENNFPKDIKSIAGGLLYNADTETKDKLINEILTEFYNIYVTIEERQFMEYYRKRSLVIGKKVSFEKDGKTFCSIAAEIDDDAKLTVALENGEKCLLGSGEVSIKLV